MLIAIGSKNPAKIIAVQNVFKQYPCEIKSVDAPSGVREQPLSDNETIRGAVNRALLAVEAIGADIGVGLEGGVQQTEYGLVLCNWGAIVARGMDPIIAGGARLPLPLEVAERLLAGEELGPVMDQYTKKANIRKKEGAVGIFTNGRIDRSEMFSHVMNLLVGQYEYHLELKKGNFPKYY